MEDDNDMTTGRQRIPKSPTDALGLPPPLGDSDQSAKLLIAAVLAAGQNGCNCSSCQLLKRFGGFMSEAVLKETQSG